MAWHAFTDRELTIRAQVQPGSKVDKVDGVRMDRLKIKIMAPATGGKANSYLINFLSRQFGVPKTSIEISRGRHSKMKTIRIHAPVLWPDWFNKLK